MNNQPNMEKLTITENKGFEITFANNYTISVQFGERNYCEGGRANDYGFTESKNAEVAILKPNGDFQLLNGLEVVGWQTPTEVAGWISFCSKL